MSTETKRELWLLASIHSAFSVIEGSSTWMPAPKNPLPTKNKSTDHPVRVRGAVWVQRAITMTTKFAIAWSTWVLFKCLLICNLSNNASSINTFYLCITPPPRCGKLKKIGVYASDSILIPKISSAHHHMHKHDCIPGARVSIRAKAPLIKTCKRSKRRADGHINMCAVRSKRGHWTERATDGCTGTIDNAQDLHAKIFSGMLLHAKTPWLTFEACNSCNKNRHAVRWSCCIRFERQSCSELPFNGTPLWSCSQHLPRTT